MLKSRNSTLKMFSVSPVSGYGHCIGIIRQAPEWQKIGVLWDCSVVIVTPILLLLISNALYGSNIPSIFLFLVPNLLMIHKNNLSS